MRKYMAVAAFIFVVPLLIREQGVAARHGLYTAVLSDHVKNGYVDYRALKADARFEKYIAELDAADPAALPSREEKLAFWINVYNAHTLKLIIDNHPVKSISALHYGGSLALATALKKTVWQTHRFTVGGKAYTLDQVEHGILRPVFRDHRIHGAIVCAAVSCPTLRGEAYEAHRVNEQLDDQMRRFMADPSKNRYDAATGTLYLSKIFNWFEKDFTGGKKSIVEALVPYMPEAAAMAVRERGGKVNIKYLPYDWALNGR
ncbi:MAG TPA: DUF547 domain-containing protein [Spirochaetes bacterium]|nr:DUF547 domain-containing protein [Spirochaetota bacterium]